MESYLDKLIDQLEDVYGSKFKYSLHKGDDYEITYIDSYGNSKRLLKIHEDIEGAINIVKDSIEKDCTGDSLVCSSKVMSVVSKDELIDYIEGNVLGKDYVSISKKLYNHLGDLGFNRYGSGLCYTKEILDDELYIEIEERCQNFYLIYVGGRSDITDLLKRDDWLDVLRGKIEKYKGIIEITENIRSEVEDTLDNIIWNASKELFTI